MKITFRCVGITEAATESGMGVQVRFVVEAMSGVSGEASITFSDKAASASFGYDRTFVVALIDKVNRRA